MFEFETQLNKLKHEVLTEVAKLAIKDKLTKEEIEKVPYKAIEGDIAMYRCCVYKERAIVLEIELVRNNKQKRAYENYI